MSFLIGGDTNKRGNYYENKFITYKYAELLSGEIKSIQQETYHQDEEKGVDVIIVSSDEKKEYYQCKSRNGTKSYWDIEDLENVIKKAITHTNSCEFILVSPLTINYGLMDIFQRSKSFSTLKEFEDNALGGQTQKEIYYKILKLLPNSTSEETLNFFHNFSFLFFPDQKTYVTNYLNSKAHIKNADKAYDLLCSYIESNNKLQIQLFYDEIYNYLKKMDVSFFALDRENDCKVIKDIQCNFINSLNRRRINDKDYLRTESVKVYNSIFNNKFTILNGESGCGKSIIAKQICDKLVDNNICFLPIDLSTYSLNTSYTNFSKNLGLSGTISMSLSKINSKEKAFVIIDQMDTIQWGSPIDQQSKDLCHEIIKDALNYNDINVILIARSINTEDISNMINYETEKSTINTVPKPYYGVYTVSKLDANFVKSIIPEYMSLSSQLKNLLTNPNNIKYYLDIKSENKNNIATVNQLINAYLNEQFQQFKEEESYAKEIILHIVNKLEKNNVLFVQKSSLFKFSERLVNALKSNGILVETNGIIKFSHQSIYDYFIAEKLYEDLENGQKLNAILRKYKNTAIANYNKIQQFLEILFQDNINFCHNIESVLFDDKIPFIFKKLAINYFTLVNETYCGFVNLYKKLISSKKYGKKYLYNLTASKQILFNVLVENKIIDKLIISNKKEDNMLVLNILMSLQNSVGICEFLNKFISLHNSKDVLEIIIHSIDDLKSSDKLFDIKMKLLSENKLSDLYVNWKNIVKSNTDRAFKYLVLLFNSNQYKENALDLDYKEFKNEIDVLLFQYKDELFKLIKTYIHTNVSKFKIAYYQDTGISVYDNEDVALLLYSLIIPLLNVDCIWEEINNKELKYIAFAHLENTEKITGIELLKKIVEYNYISNQNFQYYPPFIFKLQHFINKFIVDLSGKESNKLVEQIVNYKNSNILTFAKEKFAQRKLGIYHHFFEEEQKVLLNGIPDNKLPDNYKNYLKFLNRKFANPEVFNESNIYGVRSYHVVSGINQKNKQWSRKTFVKLLTSSKAGKEKNFSRKEKIDRQGNLISCDGLYINRFIFDSAYENRTLFADILLKEKNIRNDFIVIIFNALSNKFSNKELKEDCFPEIILKAYKKYYNCNKTELIYPLINFAQHYDYFDEWMINTLISWAKIQNEENAVPNNDSTIDYSSEWNKHFSDKQSGSIVALSRYLLGCEKEPCWWDDLYNTCYYSNKLYLAMAGVDLLLPLYKINKEKTIQLLCQLIRRYPNIIEGTESWEIIDYAIIDYYKDFYKLFNDKSLLFSDKSIKNLSNKYICYYVFYGLFANKIKRIIKISNNYNLAFTCKELLKKNISDERKFRLIKVIKLITKHNSFEANNFLYWLNENFSFFYDNNLIKPIILKSKDKYDSESYIYNLDSLLSMFPCVLKYKDIIFTTIKKYLNDKTRGHYNISNIFKWILHIYGESNDKKVKQKCLNIINKLYENQLFGTTLIDVYI